MTIKDREIVRFVATVFKGLEKHIHLRIHTESNVQVDKAQTYALMPFSSFGIQMR